MTSKQTPVSPDLQFDREWYLATYPDVALSGIDPEQHYLKIGSLIGRKPGVAAKNGPAKAWEPRAPSFEYLGEHDASHKGPALVISEDGAPDLRFQGTLAIHAHLFHLDMLPECSWWLSSIPSPFDLFVSIADAADAASVEQALSSLPSLNRLYVEHHPNRGRDIGPMVAGFGRRLAGYDFVGHFHSKKSSHTPDKKDWGTQLGHHLFHSVPHMTRVLNLFADLPELGLIFPVYHPSIKGQIKWGANFNRIATELPRLLGTAGEGVSEADLLPFPAGSFFLARTEAIRCLLDGGFTLEDFEPEAGQIDGTLAHAIERMFGLVATRQGYTFRQVRAEKPHSLGRSYIKGDPYRSRFLDAVEAGEQTELPVFSDPALAGLNIQVYTCSTGGYDVPLPFEGFIAGAEYHFFTDQPEPEWQGQWLMHPLALQHPHQIKAARKHKTQPHRLFEGADIAIWVDGNVAVTGDLTPWVARVLKEEAAFGVIPHPYRESVAEELAALERMKVDDPALMRAQVARYRGEGFPDDSNLTETNVIIMDLRRPETCRALDIWWNEIEHFSRRDQLSFDYACWKAGAKKIPLISTGLSVRADPRFAYFKHGGSGHAALGARAALANLWSGRDVVPAPERRYEATLSVDAVVCVHNSPDDVARCLRSLALARDDRTRIIIVDDGSQSPTQAVIARHLCRHPSDVLVRHEVAQGYTKSANAGMRASNADYVVLLNSDTIVPQGWAAALVHAGEADPRVGIIGPLSNAASWQSVPLTLQPSGDFAVNDLPAGMSVDDVARVCARIPADPVYPCPVVNGFCFAIKRQVIDAIGYLDEEAFPQGYGEENDYCLRLPEAGFSCGFTLSTYVYHAKSKSFSHERRKVLSKAGWEQLVAKHGKEKLGAAVQEMQHHPAFARARSWFAGLTARKEPDVKAIGFYLPQFHDIPFNDINWGPGFSEWRNVVKARPRFEGHPQPRLPGKLGFYDLRTPETLAAQGDLAREYEVFGMAVYYYRFGRERLMSAPTDRLLATPEIGPRFFYCWANEDWTRAWDGRTSDVLLKQDYGDETLRLIAADLVEDCADTRYIRIDDKPVFMIYQLNRLPDPGAAIARLRELMRDSLGIELVVGTTWNSDFRPEWEELVDFIAQFPPHRTPRKSKRELLPRETVPGAQEETGDFLESYDAVMAQSLEATDAYDRLVPGICPDWDNSPRRARQANILVGSTPEKFESWAQAAAVAAVEKHASGQIPAPLLFVNAWNEWAEGAVLEPTEKDDRAYLAAFRRGVEQRAADRDAPGKKPERQNR